MQSRRQFLTRGAALGVGAAATLTGPTVFTRHASAAGQLKILQWAHFVPAYDKWFDPWAKEWGSKRGVEVTVDHVGFADVVPRATAEVAAQAGHDIHMFLGLASAFEEHVVDLGDVVANLEKKYGKQVDLARRSTYNPFTRKQFALSDMWVPDPGNYHRKVWSDIGMPNGPSTYEDLVKAAPEIKKKAPQMQIPIGLGLSQDIDSNMAVRNILWCHGGSIQDKDGNVVLNSAETLSALEYTKRLYTAGMTPAVLSWNAASNNQAFNAQETAYILNSISAYRTAQDNKLPVIENYFFTPALKGPGGIQLASEHVMSGYVVWKFSKNQDVAKEFLTALVDAARESMNASKLYNFPSFYGAVADQGTPVAKRPESGAAWIAKQCKQDPFGSTPPDKLALLADSLKWSTNLGYPGHANPAEGEIFDTYVITDMFAKAATGALSPRDALAEASTRTKQIFDKWRRRAWWVAAGQDLLETSASRPCRRLTGGSSTAGMTRYPYVPLRPKPHEGLRRADRALGILMLVPALAYIVLLVGVPFLLAIFLSLTNSSAGSLRVLVRRAAELRGGRREPGLPARAAQHVRLHARVAGERDRPRQHPRARPAAAVPGPHAGPLPHPAAVGGADLAGDARLALDLRLDVQRDQLGPEGGGLAGPGRLVLLARRPDAGDGLDHHDPRLAHAAVLDGHPAGRAHVDPAGGARGRGPRRRDGAREDVPDHAPDDAADPDGRPALRRRVHVHRHERRVPADARRPVQLTHVLASLAFQEGVLGGDVGRGASIAVFLLPALVVLAIGMLRISRRAEVV